MPGLMPGTMRMLAFLLGLLAVAIAAAVPAPAAAQLAAPSRPLVTPVAGYAFGFDQAGTARIFAADRLPLAGPASGSNGGGWITGLRVELPLAGLLALAVPEGVNLVGSVLGGRLGAGEVNFRAYPENPDTAVADTGLIATGPQRGATLLAAKLGLAFRVPVPVPASLTVAPALLRIDPRGAPESLLDRGRAAYHPGINLGGSLDLPTYLPGLSVHLGVDDYLTFPTAELAERVERSYRAWEEPVADVRIARRVSHLVLVQAGISLTF